MFDIPDDHSDPYVIVELVSHHNIKPVRYVADFNIATYLIKVVYNTGHHRLMQESDFAIYKAEADKRYRTFLQSIKHLSDEEIKNGGCRVQGNHRTNPETFPYIYAAVSIP